ncbi:facilitated trehalose transporter Tret1-2 homolog [Bacillus rossius redtenbacheri]|uniref:facilitated trehalose transporter Tret1-2 homolog n=1 Tax=Bacillus rossius redtenbacheri TaxID=93214 RepID=UPI002FDE12AD
MEDMKTGSSRDPKQKNVNKAHILPQYLASFTVSLGAFGQGTVAGWTSPAGLPLLGGAMHFTVSDIQLSWIGALMALGAAAAVIPMGCMIDKVGRKTSMLLLVVPFTVGWALIIWADSVGMLCAGRFLTGMAGGAFAISGPVYTTEIAQKEVRGLMGSFYQNLVVSGILFTYAVGSALSPFWLSVVCAGVPLMFAVTFVFMPETPQYFLKAGEPKKARDALRWLRGPDYDMEPELQEMHEAVEEESRNSASLRELFASRGTLKGLVVSVGLLSLQQLSGTNFVTFYTTVIFQALGSCGLCCEVGPSDGEAGLQQTSFSGATAGAGLGAGRAVASSTTSIISYVAHEIYLEAGSQISPSLATIMVGACQVVFTLLSGLVVDRVGRKEAGSQISPSLATIMVGACQVVFTLLSGLVVDRVGRKVLLIVSHALMSLCMFALGAFFYLKTTGWDVSSLGWLPITSITLYFISFAVGSGPLPWVVMAEVFLPSVKGVAGAITCLVNWLLAFAVTKLFVDLAVACGMHSTLWVFAAVLLSGTVFVGLVVPETKGKTTDQIFRELNGGPPVEESPGFPSLSESILESELRGRSTLRV